MLTRTRTLRGLEDRGPLRVLFLTTSMPVGGAETLLVNLVRRLNSERVLPELGCLKEPGPLGKRIADEFPLHSRLLRSKFDVRVLGRLRRLIRERRIDAVVTVGAGDKMFWGRLAASLEGLPVICSALHSTGWPDTIGRLNRMLTPQTDAFIAVAEPHGDYLVENEGFPAEKVRVIPNGIDVEEFSPCLEARLALRRELGVSGTASVCGIVAALRPEKNHALFLQAAARVQQQADDVHFAIIGDGPERARLEAFAQSRGLGRHAHFLGSRADIATLLPGLDLFSLTSHNEANPVSILEALACEVPVVATRVGSVEETVREGVTGYLVEPGDEESLARRWLEILERPALGRRLGKAGRALVVETASLEQMVLGYEDLLCDTYRSKSGGGEAISFNEPNSIPLSVAR